jgi:putative DNA primase/helicase
MVCLVRDVISNEPRAIHRTALSPVGRKVKIGGVDRLSLGPIRGGAIKLTPDQDVSLCLGVGEGIESTLSLRNRHEFGRSPVWSLISAGGLEGLPVLAGIESLWIAVDNDASGTGFRAARTCAERWRVAGSEVFLVTPSADGLDLNDIPAEAHHA